MPDGSGVHVVTVGSDELDLTERTRLRELLDRAFDDFDDHDWAHSLGGHHLVAEVDGRPVAHAAVVERPIEISGRPFRTGYVEAVATDPDFQGRGAGSLVMHEVGRLIRLRFEIGALCTGLDGYYERFGWERWTGPTSVRSHHGPGPRGRRRTPDDDGLIFVLRHHGTATVDLDAEICCDERTGDVW